MQLTQGSRPPTTAEATSAGTSIEAQVRAGLLEVAYAQLPLAALGSAMATLIMAWVVGQHTGLRSVRGWLLAHVAITLVALLVRRAYRSGALRGALERALWARRAVTLTIGVYWGAAGFEWPELTRDTGLGVLLCAGGLSAAMTLTSAADPRGLWLFTIPSLASWLTLQAGPRPWLCALLMLYAVVMATLCHACRNVLESSLALRFQNVRLLERALADRDAAELAQRVATDALEARNRFLAEVGHDLRQPVHALALFAEVLQQPTDDAKRGDVIAAVARTTEKLSAKLERLIELSRGNP